MTNMKAAERAAELANAQCHGVPLDPNYFTGYMAGVVGRAFVQFIADVDAAARKAQGMIHQLGGMMQPTDFLSPLILPDDVDPLEALLADAFKGTRIGEIGGWAQYQPAFRAALASRGLEIVEQGE